MNYKTKKQRALLLFLATITPNVLSKKKAKELKQLDSLELSFEDDFKEYDFKNEKTESSFSSVVAKVAAVFGLGAAATTIAIFANRKINDPAKEFEKSFVEKTTISEVILDIKHQASRSEPSGDETLEVDKQPKILKYSDSGKIVPVDDEKGFNVKSYLFYSKAEKGKAYLKAACDKVLQIVYTVLNQDGSQKEGVTKEAFEKVCCELFCIYQLLGDDSLSILQQAYLLIKAENKPLVENILRMQEESRNPERPEPSAPPFKPDKKLAALPQEGIEFNLKENNIPVLERFFIWTDGQILGKTDAELAELIFTRCVKKKQNAGSLYFQRYILVEERASYLSTKANYAQELENKDVKEILGWIKTYAQQNDLSSLKNDIRETQEGFKIFDNQREQGLFALTNSQEITNLSSQNLIKTTGRAIVRANNSWLKNDFAAAIQAMNDVQEDQLGLLFTLVSSVNNQVSTWIDTNIDSKSYANSRGWTPDMLAYNSLADKLNISVQQSSGHQQQVVQAASDMQVLSVQQFHFTNIENSLSRLSAKEQEENNELSLLKTLKNNNSVAIDLLRQNVTRVLQDQALIGVQAYNPRLLARMWYAPTAQVEPLRTMILQEINVLKAVVDPNGQGQTVYQNVLDPAEKQIIDSFSAAITAFNLQQLTHDINSIFSSKECFTQKDGLLDAQIVKVQALITEITNVLDANIGLPSLVGNRPNANPVVHRFTQQEINPIVQQNSNTRRLQGLLTQLSQYLTALKAPYQLLVAKEAEIDQKKAEANTIRTDINGQILTPFLSAVGSVQDAQTLLQEFQCSLLASAKKAVSLQTELNSVKTRYQDIVGRAQSTINSPLAVQKQKSEFFKSLKEKAILTMLGNSQVLARSILDGYVKGLSEVLGYTSYELDKASTSTKEAFAVILSENKYIHDSSQLYKSELSKNTSDNKLKELINLIGSCNNGSISTQNMPSSIHKDLANLISCFDKLERAMKVEKLDFTEIFSFVQSEIGTDVTKKANYQRLFAKFHQDSLIIKALRAENLQQSLDSMNNEFYSDEILNDLNYHLREALIKKYNEVA